MNDQYAFNKQISEFLAEYNNRFKMFSHMNMPGKMCYQANLNRQDVNAVIRVYLPELFPRQPPLVVVVPPFQNEIITQNGTINEDSLKMWNFNSSLKNTVSIILSKLEGKSKIESGQNLTQLISSGEEDQLMTDLVKDLNSKTIEELILINFNPEEYVYDLTQKQRNCNLALLQEVNLLSDQADKLKMDSEDIRKVIDENKQIYDEKEKELREVYAQKQLLDSKFTVEKLIEEMKTNIDENYQKPRQKLINDFINKRIDFESFKQSFKELSQKYHYYNIIKDKMNLYK